MFWFIRVNVGEKPAGDPLDRFMRRAWGVVFVVFGILAVGGLLDLLGVIS